MAFDLHLEHYLSPQPDHNNPTVEVMPFLSLTSLLLRHRDEVAAITGLLRHPCVFCRFVPVCQVYPTWLATTMINHISV